MRAYLNAKVYIFFYPLFIKCHFCAYFVETIHCYGHAIVHGVLLGCLAEWQHEWCYEVAIHTAAWLQCHHLTFGIYWLAGVHIVECGGEACLHLASALDIEHISCLTCAAEHSEIVEIHLMIAVASASGGYGCYGGGVA